MLENIVFIGNRCPEGVFENVTWPFPVKFYHVLRRETARQFIDAIDEKIIESGFPRLYCCRSHPLTTGGAIVAVMEC